jgi:hypothetical protein
VRSAGAASTAAAGGARPAAGSAAATPLSTLGLAGLAVRPVDEPTPGPGGSARFSGRTGRM